MRQQIFILLLLIAAVVVGAQSQVPNRISYQGLLTTSSGTPLIDGAYNFQFDLYDSLTGGTSQWSEVQNGDSVKRGTFDVILGSVAPLNLQFTKRLYLQVKLTAGPAGPAYPVVFLPRSELTSAPYAIHAHVADSLAGGVAGAYLPITGGTLTGAISSTGSPAITMGKGNFGTGNINTGGNAFVAGSYNRATGDSSTVGGGSSNIASATQSTVGGGLLNNASGIHATIGGGIANIASDRNATVAGGASNTASAQVTTISGGFANMASDTAATVGGGVLNTSTALYATVGGGKFNHARGLYSVVSGGGGPFINDSNSASGDFSVIGGGGANIASSNSASVGGGNTNTASGSSASVGGGNSNNATNSNATVGGGSGNTASGISATVGGGSSNSASGISATIPGGYGNVASGNFSFAAGQLAKANHDGAFVWSDFSAGNFVSTGANQFLIRAAGGVGIGTNSPATALHVYGAGDQEISIQSSDPNGRRWTLQSSQGAYHGIFQIIQRAPSVFSALTIDTVGHVGIGTISPNYQLEVNGDINAIGAVRSNGTALTSDIRFKKDILTLTGALGKVTALRGVSYDWRKDEFPGKNFSGEKQIGFIAQELEKVVPELVSTGADGYKGVDYARLTPVLVEAIKELNTKLSDAKEENHRLAARLTELESLVKSLASEQQNTETKDIGDAR